MNTTLHNQHAIEPAVLERFMALSRRYLLSERIDPHGQPSLPTTHDSQTSDAPSLRRLQRRRGRAVLGGAMASA